MSPGCCVAVDRTSVIPLSYRPQGAESEAGVESPSSNGLPRDTVLASIHIPGGQPMNPILPAITLALILGVPGSRAAARAESGNTALVAKVLADMPVIDGHNDLPWEIRERFASNVDAVDLKQNTALLPRPANAPADQAPLMTDIPRLRSGGVGAQFWSVWVPTDSRDA